MRELLMEMPDADALLDFSREELGEHLLFSLKKRMADRPQEFLNGGQFHPQNLMGEVWPQSTQGPQYADKNRQQIDQAQVEAWDWLRSQGHIVPALGTNGSNGWCVLSRRAAKLQSPAEFQQMHASSKAAREVLHPQIAKVWPRLQRGDLDGAAFDAMHAVEVAVRDAARLSNGDIGVDLMRSAFHP